MTNLYCLTGAYEDVYSVVSRLEPGTAFLDIGANAGLFSLVASPLVGSSGIVVAFEPSPRTFQDLTANRALNNCENLLLVNAAVGARTGMTAFDCGPAHHSGIARLDPGGSEQVLQLGGQTLTAMLEAVVQARPVVIKIDVEGAEDLVIDGLSEFIRQSRVKLMVVEIHAAMERFGSTPHTLYAKLASLGFDATLGLGAATHYNEVFVRRDA
jgi:FkbM family methyltransferase